jgi:hypothetical protein
MPKVNCELESAGRGKPWEAEPHREPPAAARAGEGEPAGVAGLVAAAR